jgi:DNA-binding transcriptional LysR family regulator
MGMDLRLLEAFRTVMDCQSMTGAAKVMGVTQPAVSAQIARLESQIGFELFERVGGRLKPTDRGRRFHKEVLAVLGGIDKLSDVARNIRSGEAETLVVATHPGASISLMPGVVTHLLEARPEARIRMINRTSEEVCAIFEAGGADVGVAEWPIHLQGVDLARYALEAVAVLPPGHALAACETVAPADLASGPFLAMSDARLPGHLIRSALGAAGERFAPVVESEYFSTLCALAAAGCGAAIVDTLSARSLAPLGFAIRPLAPALTFEIGVFRRAADAPTPLSDALVAAIEAAILENGGRRVGR